MELDSCRNLKYALSERLPSLATRATEPFPTLALGIGRGTTGYALAVRVHGEDQADDLLARLDDIARGEIDARTVGTIRPQHTTPPMTPAELRKCVRPLVPGLSLGQVDITAGTLGGFVTVDGALHVLSNNHVLANSDLGRLGDPVLQPGPADGGSADADRIGTLAAWVDLTATPANLVDTAIARLDEDVEVDADAYPGGPLGPPPADPPTDPAVAKIGRTTGLTSGRVTAFEVDGLRIDYPEGTLTFDDQIEIEGDAGSFSESGDSGSVIWTVAGRAAYALLFAGSSSGGSNGAGLTYANPMATVLDRLGATWGAP